MSDIRENYFKVVERIEKAARRAGRDPAQVKLVAVSKTVEPSRIREAVDAGVSILGENYVQEAKKKIEEIGPVASWHFIGHLQTNKAKYAARLFDAVHSVDGLPLAEELDRRAAQNHRTLSVMIEVNLSGETTKFGTDEEKVLNLALKISDLTNLSLQGLMTMPPYFDSPEMSRPYFVRLRELRDRLAGQGISIRDLSMGISNDFEVAVEEGATFVRVGTAIFGTRKA